MSISYSQVREWATSVGLVKSGAEIGSSEWRFLIRAYLAFLPRPPGVVT